jgi:hypothetical protein
MIDVARALEPPDGWEDTREQAQIRACLLDVLDDRHPIVALKIASEMITVLRDQILTGLGQIRREAAHEAQQSGGEGMTGMTIMQMVKATGQTKQTVSRLLSEYRADVRQT